MLDRTALRDLRRIFSHAALCAKYSYNIPKISGGPVVIHNRAADFSSDSATNSGTSSKSPPSTFSTRYYPVPYGHPRLRGCLPPIHAVSKAAVTQLTIRQKARGVPSGHDKRNVRGRTSGMLQASLLLTSFEYFYRQLLYDQCGLHITKKLALGSVCRLSFVRRISSGAMASSHGPTGQTGGLLGFHPGPSVMWSTIYR